MAHIFHRLEEISIKELLNQPLNDTDYSFIKYAGQEIAEIASYSDPEQEEWVSETDDRMAVVADVHTDPNSGRVLEVATGDAHIMYVIVQDHNGNLRLTQGGVFSYYEFPHPMGDRLTDESWHTMLDNNEPEPPSWVPIS
ncbi:MAG: DUF3160 domain-containing protein [Promethearchaeota archaeon]